MQDDFRLAALADLRLHLDWATTGFRASTRGVGDVEASNAHLPYQPPSQVQARLGQTREAASGQHVRVQELMQSKKLDQLKTNLVVARVGTQMLVQDRNDVIVHDPCRKKLEQIREKKRA
jgi:hypothetical protein